MTKLYMIVFVMLAGTFTFSTLFQPYPLSWVLKILPILLLVLVAYKKSIQAFHWLFLLGLIFSAAGDFLLDYDRENWFVYGLGAFLVAHLFYIASLLPLKKQNLLFACCYIIFGGVFFNFIHASLATLFIPVFFYMVVLLATGIATLTSKKSNPWLIMGGLCFIVSDSLIALDKFYVSFSAAGFIIMATYYIAQLFLVTGIYNAATCKHS